MRVYTLEEAEQWFLENASGNVKCVRDGNEKTCNSYPEAKAFFTASESEESKSDDDSTSIGLGFLAGAASGMFSDPASDIASTVDTTPDTSSSESIGGGGDFGGAGSSGDY